MVGRGVRGGPVRVLARRWWGGGLVLPLALSALFAAGCDSSSSSQPDAAGGGGHAGSRGSAGGHAMGTGGSSVGPGIGGSTGAGGAVVDAGGAGGGGATGAGGVVADAGAPDGTGTGTGAGGGGGSGCPLPTSVPGAWSEVAAPAGLTSFAVRDSFALGADDIIFAGVISAASGTGAQARFLRWTGGCWSVELSVPVSADVFLGPAPSVHGSAPSDLWAVAGQSIFHRLASGPWQPVDDGWRSHVGVAANGPAPNLNLNRIRVAAPDDVWITETNNIFHRTAAGWTGYNFDQAQTAPAISFRFADLWIDSPASVWVAGGSDVQGSTMDPAFVHHFDGAAWTPFGVATYHVYSVWRSGSILWLATPGNLATDNGTTVQRTLRAFSGAQAPTVPIAGFDPAAPVSITRLWGRSAQDVWGAGDNLVHYDGSSWSVVADAPAPVRSNDFTGAFVGGDPAATWVVTSGARFFRRPVAPGVTTP